MSERLKIHQSGTWPFGRDGHYGPHTKSRNDRMLRRIARSFPNGIRQKCLFVVADHTIAKFEHPLTDPHAHFGAVNLGLWNPHLVLGIPKREAAKRRVEPFILGDQLSATRVFVRGSSPAVTSLRI